MMVALNCKLPSMQLKESPIFKTPKFVAKYNELGDITICEDFDGFYFYSEMTKKRSASVSTCSMLTENMIKAIL